jgi:8-oxo-dGTP pyrophosphatase MutT (NUDIX family)
MMSIGRFYAMIGALIRHPNSGKYLILRRSAQKDVGAGAWECVTGRVDQGESFPEALHREVKEELGVEVQIDFFLRTEHFYRGESVPENEMVGVMYCCSLEDPDAIQISWEHDEARWTTLDEASGYLTEEYWLVKLIQRAERLRALIPEALLEFYRQTSI